MLEKVEVGQRYDWGNDSPGDLLTITKIEDDKFWFRCDDGYESNAYLNQTGGWKLLDDKKEDVIVSPAHYNSTSITPFQVIDSWNLDFYLGNVIKYICRKDKKNNALEDLKKAQQYLNIYIQKLENGNTK